MISLRLIVHEPGETEPAIFNLSGDDAVIGRDDGCDVVIEDATVSGRHGVLRATAQGYTFTDLASSNGSAVRIAGGDAEPVESGVPVPVAPGDELILGTADAPVRVVVEAGAAPYARARSATRTVLAKAPLTDLLASGVGSASREEGLFTLAAHALAAPDANGLAAAALGLLQRLFPQATGRAVVITGAGLAGGAGDTLPAGLREAAMGADGVVILSDDGADPLPMTTSIARDGTAAAMVAPLLAGGVFHGAMAAWSPLGPAALPADALKTASIAASLIALSAASLAVRREGERERQRLLDENKRLRGGADGRRLIDPIGQSPAFVRAVELARSVASSDVPLLLHGETGTGKEVLARNVHAWSRRSGKAFIAFNCAAVPETLIESELFGHARGAFTGAGAERKGLFEEADGGTLFLDEIGEMPAVMQAKLLRVLQDGEVRRVGASRPMMVDVRVVSATHRDLPKMVADGAFRADLMYRLNAVTVTIPTLRERGDDVTVLAHFLLGRACEQARKRIPGFAPGALWALSMYPFPGNVRELENEILRAVALTPEGEAIEATAFSDRLSASGPAPGSVIAAPHEMTLKDAVSATERAVIEAALARGGGNVSQAARNLGLTRPGLYKVMERLGMR